MGFIDKLKSGRHMKDIFGVLKPTGDGANTTQENKALTTMEFQAAGSCYYTNNLNKLACPNSDYKKTASSTYSGRIYRYNYINKPVKLVPEPKNRYDKNAIMIIIAGELAGYVPSDLCQQVKEILSSYDIKYISAFIGGGQYKLISDGKIISRGENDLRVNIKIAYT